MIIITSICRINSFPSDSIHLPRNGGLEVTRYWDEPGLYTLNQLQCEAECRYLQERFAFYTCVKGEGTLNGVSIRQGETVLVPAHTGWLNLQENMDLFMASYRN